jgi:hypothetical protein
MGTTLMSITENHGPIERITVGSYTQAVDDHQQAFEAFVHLLAIGVLHIATCLVALAIGGAENHWKTTLALIVLATLAAAFGAATRLAWRPGALVLACAFACLALFG